MNWNNPPENCLFHTVANQYGNPFVKIYYLEDLEGILVQVIGFGTEHDEVKGIERLLELLERSGATYVILDQTHNKGPSGKNNDYWQNVFRPRANLTSLQKIGFVLSLELFNVLTTQKNLKALEEAAKIERNYEVLPFKDLDDAVKWCNS